MPRRWRWCAPARPRWPRRSPMPCGAGTPARTGRAPAACRECGRSPTPTRPSVLGFSGGWRRPRGTRSRRSARRRCCGWRPRPAPTSWSRSDCLAVVVERRPRLHRRAVVRLERLEEVLGRAVAEGEVAPLRSRPWPRRRAAPASRASVPHCSGEGTPAGGGTWAPTILNIWPMKPSGVQLASPMRPPGRHTRSELGRGPLGVRA